MADRSAAFSVRFDPDTVLENRNVSFKNILRCRKDLRPFTGRLLLLLLFCCTAAVCFAQVPLYLGRLVDLFAGSMIDAVIREHFTPDIAALLQCALPAAALLVLHAVFYYLTGRLASSTASGFADRLRQKVFAKILCVRMEYLDMHSKESVLETASQQIDILGQSVNLLLSRALYACVLLVSLVVSCARLGVVQAALPALVILLYALARLLGHTIRGRADLPQADVPAPTDAQQMYRNLSVLQASGRLAELSRSLADADAQRLRTVRRARFADNLGRITALLLTGMAVAAALFRGVYTGGAVRIGVLLSLVLYIRRLESPLTDVSFFSSSLYSMASCAQIVYDFLDADEETGGRMQIAPDKRCRIEFRNVCFAYPGTARDVLHDLSFCIQDRGVTVIRGETGVGKTTVLKLLTAFYRPQSGSITLNGTDTAQLDLQAYRRLFAMIVQDGTLFERTVAENIAYPDAPDDMQKITNVLEEIGQPDFANALDNGLQTVFSPGAHTLSDGQVQLVLIARALLHRKRFLILDESLSHLDAQSAQSVLRALHLASAHTGVILISHRDAYLPPADQTLSLDDSILKSDSV